MNSPTPITDFTNYFPHRFENILLDSVTITGEHEGTFDLLISPDDSQGRHIFLDQVSAGHFIVSRPVTLEILALAAITASGGISGDEMLFYAGLSNVTFHDDIRAGIPLRGTVKKVSEKRAFVQYEGTIYQEDKKCVEANLTAFFTTKSELSIPARDVTPETTPSPDRPGRRVDCMTLITTAENITEDSCSGSFIYPKSHPLTRGHFESLPVMMGVMQLMSLEELATAYLAQQNLPKGNHTLSAKGSLENISDSTKACDARGLIFDYDNSDSVAIPQAKLVSLQKLSFKSMILPGDSVSATLSNCTLS